VIGPLAVQHLTDAYRHMGESDDYADLVIAHRHQDWTPKNASPR
jgi:hypothetical protein